VKTLENFVVEYHLKRWLRARDTRSSSGYYPPAEEFMEMILDAPHRSIITRGKDCKGDRLALLEAEYASTAVRQRLLELNTTFEFEVPQMLRSLSYWGGWPSRGSRSSSAPTIRLKLPSTLRHLRISYQQALAYDLFSKLEELPHLFYLVLGGPLTTQQLKPVVKQLLLLKNLRVFTVLRSEPIRNIKGYAAVSYEEYFAHQEHHPEYRPRCSCLAYRRAMLRAVMLERSRFKLPNCSAEYLLQMLDSHINDPPVRP